MPIPKTVRASAAVAQHQTYRGEVAVQALQRLDPLLATSKGVLSADLAITHEGRRDFLRGTIAGELQLVCRRCDRAYAWPLRLAMDLCLVHSEEAEREATEAGEAWLVQDDILPLQEMIEDEVLLALPMIPRCKSCENDTEFRASSGSQTSQHPVDEAAENPFAALKRSLKSKQ